MGIRLPLVVSALVLLTSCTNENPRAAAIPVYDLKLQGRSSGAAIVSEGDTLSGIANRYGLTINDIIQANMLGQGGNMVRPNQRLLLPPPRTYTVKAGDTFDRIARMFDTSEQALARENNLSPPYDVYAGQTLSITPAPVQDRPIESNMAYNDNAAPEYIAPDQPMQNGYPRPPSGDGMVEAEPLTPQQGQTTTTIPLQPQQMQQDVAPVRSRFFKKPVEGDVVSAYGPKQGGLYNDGINIGAKAGTRVGAADAGTVIFAGEGPEGYGNMVLVKHQDGYFTVYSHLSQVSVQEGAQVGAGSTLGRVGATGKVKEPQLHFEIRKGTQALDPERFL
ncbi:MAG: LysM peptidoglycan-binding domain-containing M23 family metallopeptidase [Alphaproteobacteria bacterium]|nr:LysM peptidoglycan-binding domain-containing M23 family metallopeptidase [Alphaproteobacteria bacterium]